MSPIGHGGLGLLGWQIFDRKKTAGSMALFVAAANLADIDFLFALLFGPQPLFIHQSYTHNLVFVLAGSLLLALLLSDGRSRLGLVLAGLSHLAVDIFVVDTVAPIGFRLFFPFSDTLFNVGLFPFLQRGPWKVLFSARNLGVLALEFGLFVLPVLILLWKLSRRRIPSAAFWRL